MDKRELRLELLRLVYRHDRSPVQNTEAARIFEQYVAEQDAPMPSLEKRRPGRPKKVDNPFDE